MPAIGGLFYRAVSVSESPVRAQGAFRVAVSEPKIPVPDASKNVLRKFSPFGCKRIDLATSPYRKAFNEERAALGLPLIGQDAAAPCKPSSTDRPK